MAIPLPDARELKGTLIRRERTWGHSALLTSGPAWFTLITCREQHERLSVRCGITP
jgi:hypothetical protein